MKSDDPGLHLAPPAAPRHDDLPSVGLADLLAWVGESKRLIGGVTLAAALVAGVYAFTAPFVYTAKTTLLAPNPAQTGSSAALAATPTGSPA